MAPATDIASAVPDHDGQPTEHELVITRTFAAPRRLVFKMWAAPEHAARWWGPAGFELLTCRMDVRPGGAWYRRMRSPQGTVHVKHGVYREVVEPERLVFTYINEDVAGQPDQETLVTVTFTEASGKTTLTLRHTLFPSREARDGHGIGWGSAMERFAAYVAAA